MKRKLVIIKLGGSVITDKSRSRGVFRKQIVERLAREILNAKKVRNFELIIVHGAGSYGHPLAKKYNLHKGYLGSKSSEGFALTKKAMFELSLLIWDSLSKVGLNSCVVEPSAVIVASGGSIENFNTEFIENLISKKIIPVLFGDTVFDEQTGFSIISGDLMVSYLAKKFRADKVIFVSDVDGVFDKNPKVYKDAKLIVEVNEKNYKKIITNMAIYNENDISGEMKGKILSIRDELGDTSVEIINGFKSKRLVDSLLSTRQGIGTRFGF